MYSGVFSSIERVVLIVQAVCRALGAAGARGWMRPEGVILVSRRVVRARNLLVALVERMRQGRFRSRASRAGTARQVVADTAAPVTPAVGERARSDNQILASRLPRRFGWLVWLVPQEAGPLAGQLRAVLAEPGMMVLLADAPQAMRMLRPLCRMLGVRLDVTRRDPDAPPAAVPAVAWVPPLAWGWDLTLPAVGWWVPLPERDFKPG